MPSFLQAIARWQQETGIAADRTVLVGFSQGAILSLESTQVEGAPACGRVVAIAGRFAQPVRRAPPCPVHLVHGDQDGVVPAQSSVDAAAALHGLGAQVTLDLLPGLGHGIDGRVVQALLRHLERPTA
ncbi:dienelactone hydrolase family protein [Ramlibacter sp. USB13]|uniref:Dienelactone hydrolase family protein n=1 Tax=Ramlibacter cellulosilyticus TaxID=2764187 RepID=A0A923SC85_9BURK|nr:dienelactone hydrolase family protein [Ramlibacter cellulosilyticus]MBC5784629.1 dienelactone hydrolase family protein [Ramlibacter cellulosilyticus]